MFPFLPSKWRIVYEAPEAKAKREAREQERSERGPLPDDYLELLLFIDVYNFEGATAYSGSGLCFRLGPTRSEVQLFYEDLRREYLAFRGEWKVQEANEAEWGPGYEPPRF